MLPDGAKCKEVRKFMEQRGKAMEKGGRYS